MSTVQITNSPITGLPARDVNAQFQNAYANALASGDTRYQLKEVDRPGMSRSAGSLNQAGIRASQALSDGIANAYSQQLQNQQYNANLNLSSSTANEQYGQALSALQQQAAYANQLAAIQRQGALYGLIGNLIR